MTSFLLGLISVFLIGFVIWEKRKTSHLLQERNRILQTIKKVNRIILEELDFETVTQKVADTIPNELQFATGVVAILDQERQVLRRVAASRTKEAEEAIKALRVPFSQIEISVNDPNNLMARAIREKRPFITHDVYDVLGPVLNREEAAQIQKIMFTKTTVVYPIYMDSKPIGVFLASTKKDEKNLTSYELEIIQEFIEGSAMALQHAILYRDIKSKTEQLRFANERLKELDKLKDDFVSIASHELRTPMTAIRSYVWMALNRADISLSETMKKYLSRTLISTERLINLVNDMLNVSRIEAGRIEVRPQIFDIQALVEEVVSEVEPKASERMIQIQVEKSRLPKIFADPDKVSEVLMNLLGNALKFTPPEGKITVGFFTDGLVVETLVKDTGAGISREDLGRLFQKFGRLDNSYVAVSSSSGTGLGLYISKSLVEMMGGKIWASSEGLGKGATFTFSLPIASKETLAQAEKYTKKVIGEVKGLEPVAI